MSCPSSQAEGQEQKHLLGWLWVPASNRMSYITICNYLSNIKYIIHYSENLYPIEARHADCIHHREENLQLKKGSNVPCVLKIAKDITKKCVISSFRIDKDFHVEEFISTIQETQIT